MTKEMVPLNEVARVFAVHPRTILRAITGNINEYWTEGHNPEVDLTKVAKAYGCTVFDLKAILEGRDSLLTPDQAAAELQVQPRTFRNHKPRHLKSGGIVRYLRSVIVKRALGD